MCRGYLFLPGDVGGYPFGYGGQVAGSQVMVVPRLPVLGLLAVMVAYFGGGIIYCGLFRTLEECLYTDQVDSLA